MWTMANRTSGTSNEPTRRERYRAETLAEIKVRALAHMTRDGIGALSLNAIANEMGMTGPALYRYIDSRDELLTMLIADGFTSLAGYLEAAEAEPAESAADRMSKVSRAYRQWALEHTTEFGLVFGDPIPGFAAPQDGPTVEANLRAMSALARSFAAMWRESGGRAAPGVVSPSLAKGLLEGAGQVIEGLPPEALAEMMGSWSRLHGVVTLEVWGHLVYAVGDVDAYFEYELSACQQRAGVAP